MRLGWCWSVVAVLTAACLDIDEAAQKPDASSPDAGVGGAFPACDGAPCAPAVDGWEGPFAVVEGQSLAPECPSGFASAGVTNVDPSPTGPADCECFCELKGGCLVASQFYSDSSCTQLKEVLSTQCGNPGSGAKGYQAVVVGTPPTCVAASFVTRPAVKWAKSFRACTPSSSCADLCALAPSTARRCVGRPGAAPCPAPYPDQEVVFRSYTEGRDCSSCGCGAPTCGTAELFSTGGCGGAPLKTIPTPSGCVALTTSPQAVKQTAAAACPVTTPPAPTGSVEAADPYTLCCQ